MSSETPLSFVIPVRNDAERLRRCLVSIRASAGTRLVEIVVADNGSTDASAAVAREAGARIVSAPHVRLGALRNLAAKATTGDVIAFVDADHEIAHGWVAAAIEILSYPAVVAAGAPYSPPGTANWVQRCYDGLRSHPSGSEAVEWLGSGNMIVRRAAFERVGGFDVDLDTCEDVDLSRKLRATGGRMVADARLASTHHGDPSTLGGVFLGEMWRGRDNVKVSLRSPRSWRTLISAALPLATLAAVLAILAGLGARIAGRPMGLAVATVAFGAIVLLVAARAARLRRTASRSARAKLLAVAAAYEFGRAFALAARAGYGKRRKAAA